jgi:hypothetical protein
MPDHIQLLGLDRSQLLPPTHRRYRPVQTSPRIEALTPWRLSNSARRPFLSDAPRAHPNPSRRQQHRRSSANPGFPVPHPIFSNDEHRILLYAHKDPLASVGFSTASGWPLCSERTALKTIAAAQFRSRSSVREQTRLSTCGHRSVSPATLREAVTHPNKSTSGKTESAAKSPPSC